MSNWKEADTTFEEFFDHEQIFIIPDTPDSSSNSTSEDPLRSEDSLLILNNEDFGNNGNVAFIFPLKRQYNFGYS